MFDYSYLDRISSNSSELHLEMLEIFLDLGRKVYDELRVFSVGQQKDSIVLCFTSLYSNFRILGLHQLLREAETLEQKIQESSGVIGEDMKPRITKFTNNLSLALEQAERDILQYKESLKV